MEERGNEQKTAEMIVAEGPSGEKVSEVRHIRAGKVKKQCQNIFADALIEFRIFSDSESQYGGITSPPARVLKYINVVCGIELLMN